MKRSVFSKIFPFLRGGERRAQLDAETDNTLTLGAHGWNLPERDRPDYDRETLQEQALEAWRVNPLARRIVGLTSQYVVGGGVSFSTKDPRLADFLDAFWNHPLNRLPVRIYEWCDELTRTGNLFLLVSTDASGMSYLRAVPAAQIEKIDTLPNDVEQEICFWPKATSEDLNPRPWAAVNSPQPESSLETSAEHEVFSPKLLHYAINRPVGAVWGESDLAPLLKWLSRYANWLEDRARLNRYRNAFLFVVKSKFTTETERKNRQAALNLAPPSPGSIIVSDESEEWSVINPQLEAGDANTDGLALKKMIASGAGVPLHFLAEPESSTRTTAESAGGPTYRHFEQRQEYFMWLLRDVLRVVIERRALVDRRLNSRVEVSVRGADISARDNVSLAMAASNMLGVLSEVRNRGLIDDSEFLRLMYRFCGESVDVEEMLARGAKAGEVRDLNPPVFSAVTGEREKRPARRKKDPTLTERKPRRKQPEIDPETGELPRAYQP